MSFLNFYEASEAILNTNEVYKCYIANVTLIPIVLQQINITSGANFQETRYDQPITLVKSGGN